MSSPQKELNKDPCKRMPGQPERNMTPAERNQPARNPGTQRGVVSRQLKERHWFHLLKEPVWSFAERSCLEKFPKVALERERACSCAWALYSLKVREHCTSHINKTTLPKVWPERGQKQLTVRVGESDWGQKEAEVSSPIVASQPEASLSQERREFYLWMVF